MNSATIFFALAFSSSILITGMYYKIIQNFQKHSKLSSRLLFLNEKVPKAFALLSLASLIFVGVLAAIITSNIFQAPEAVLRTLIGLLMLSQLFNISATLYWQKVLLNASTKHSEQKN